jgi:hypothetical protein
VQELLKLVRGVQATLNQGAPQLTTPRRSESLPHSEGTKTVLLSPDTGVTNGSHPLRVSTEAGTHLVPSALSLGGEQVTTSTLLKKPINAFDKCQDIFVDGARTATMDTVVNDTAAPTSSKSHSKGRGRKRAMSPTSALPTGRIARTPLPGICTPPIAYSTTVQILHPGHEGEVARGKVGASWKNTKGLLGPLCEPGQQMVQVHRIVIPGVPLMFIEDRHHAMTLDGAVTPPGHKPLYIKWDTRYMRKLTTGT